MKKILFLFAALILSFSAHAQNGPGFRIKGLIFDQATHECLNGTILEVKNREKYTSANYDGEFILDGLQRGDTLIASFVGYHTKKSPSMPRRTI